MEVGHNSSCKYGLMQNNLTLCNRLHPKCDFYWDCVSEGVALYFLSHLILFHHINSIQYFRYNSHRHDSVPLIHIFMKVIMFSFYFEVALIQLYWEKEFVVVLNCIGLWPQGLFVSICMATLHCDCVFTYQSSITFASLFKLDCCDWCLHFWSNPDLSFPSNKRFRGLAAYGDPELGIIEIYNKSWTSNFNKF